MTYKEQAPNNERASFEILTLKMKELEEKKDVLLDPYEKFFVQKRAAPTPEAKEKIEKELEEYMLSIHDELLKIKDEIVETRKKLTILKWKDLCLDYRKITARRDELYETLMNLPEGDPEISNIEDQIKEMENQLAQNIKELNTEGISEEEAKMRDF